MVHLEAAIQGLFNIVILYQVYLRNSCGGWELISSRATGSLSTVLVKGAPSWVFLKYVSQFIIYFVNGCFGGPALGGCFIIFSALFIFNLTWKENFLESTLRGWIFDKYLVLHQLFIKHQLCAGNLKRFPFSFIDN